MAARDPDKSARNKQIEAYKEDLRALLPDVLKEAGFESEASLNATVGGKSANFIDLKNEVITSSEQYVSSWLEGFRTQLNTGKYKTAYDYLYDKLRASKVFQEYLYIFLRRSYLNHYEELSKVRPHVDHSEAWIGQNNADFGLLITPRFKDGAWENDKSEIRHFKPDYWSVGHVLKTGLVIPDKNEVIDFPNVDAYLKFFEHVLVRGTASPHQRAIAERYSKFVRASDFPEQVPLLIPEFRYDGRLPKHKYRLDFCVIDAGTMNKIGFELSPWSTHGLLTGTAGKTQKQINEEAAENFDKEMRKHKDFFRKHNVIVLIYTDENLKNIESVFDDMSIYLKPRAVAKQLKFHLLSDFFK